jgi:hypothetical protein
MSSSMTWTPPEDLWSHESSSSSARSSFSAPGRSRVRRGFVRRLPHPAHFFRRRGPPAASLRDLPHGLRPSAMGDVFLFQARRAFRPKTTEGSARRRRRPHLPDLPHAGRQSRSPNRLGILQALGVLDPQGNYALWYGWSEMQRDLTEIKELAAQMRAEKTRAAAHSAAKATKQN